MKITYRIPNKPDMFAYLVEVEAEGVADTPTASQAESIANDYGTFAAAFKPTEGLTGKEMDLIIECMALGKTVIGGTEMWSKSTQAQKDEINRLKRALARIKSKQDKN